MFTKGSLPLAGHTHTHTHRSQESRREISRKQKKAGRSWKKGERITEGVCIITLHCIHVWTNINKKTKVLESLSCKEFIRGEIYPEDAHLWHLLCRRDWCFLAVSPTLPVSPEVLGREPWKSLKYSLKAIASRQEAAEKSVDLIKNCSLSRTLPPHQQDPIFQEWIRIGKAARVRVFKKGFLRKPNEKRGGRNSNARKTQSLLNLHL